MHKLRLAPRDADLHLQFVVCIISAQLTVL